MRLGKSFDSRATDMDSFNSNKVKRILVVSSTAIGDTLLSTPAIKAVRQRYPDAKIFAHFNRDNMELFENNPHINGIISYYGGYKKFFKTIRTFREYKFDLVLILHGNEPQATPMAYLSGAPFILKLPNRNEYSFLLSNKAPTIKWDNICHGIEQRLKIAELADCKIKDKRMVLPINQKDQKYVSELLTKEGVGPYDTLVGFQVSASTVSRMWFPDRFINLGKRLVDYFPKIRILITGSPEERKYCEDIKKEIGDRAIVAAGKVPLRLMPALINRLVVLVTGDTGIMHIAFAVRTPVLGLFAVSSWSNTGALYDQEKHTVIQKWKTCDPCAGKRCKYQKCMENISVEEVFLAMEGLLVKEFNQEKERVLN